jgi:hypothetical protein
MSDYDVLSNTLENRIRIWNEVENEIFGFKEVNSLDELFHDEI